MNATAKWAQDSGTRPKTAHCWQHGGMGQMIVPYPEDIPGIQLIKIRRWWKHDDHTAIDLETCQALSKTGVRLWLIDFWQAARCCMLYVKARECTVVHLGQDKFRSDSSNLVDCYEFVTPKVTFLNFYWRQLFWRFLFDLPLAWGLSFKHQARILALIHEDLGENGS